MRWPDPKPHEMNGPIYVKKDGETVRTEDPEDGQKTWKRKYPITAKYPSRCRICHEPIKVGDRIAYKPNYPADHWNCYTGTMIEKGRQDSGLDGTRKYTSKWFTGSGSRGLSLQAAKDLEAIARVRKRREQNGSVA